MFHGNKTRKLTNKELYHILSMQLVGHCIRHKEEIASDIVLREQMVTPVREDENVHRQLAWLKLITVGSLKR